MSTTATVTATTVAIVDGEYGGRAVSPLPPAHDDARTCPWCGTPALKDAACNWVCCGLDVVHGFVPGAGCGRQWCFQCSRKLCGAPLHAATVTITAPVMPLEPAVPAVPAAPIVPVAVGTSTNHTLTCCRLAPDFSLESYCRGGHNSHAPRRW